MKLTARLLWLPLGLFFAAFLAMGAVIGTLFSGYASDARDHEVASLIASERLSLSNAAAQGVRGQGVSNAFFGLEVGDDGPAQQLAAQLAPSGFDGLAFADLSGEILYSEGVAAPEGALARLKTAERAKGQVTTALVGSTYVAWAPAFDVETPKGFLVFVVSVPEQLSGYADALGADLTGAELAVSERLGERVGELEARSAQFTETAALRLGITLLLGLAGVALVLGVTVRSLLHAVHALNEVATAVAEGDLDHEIALTRTDEIGALAQAFQDVVARERALAEVAEAVGRGDLSVEVRAASGRDHLAVAFQTLIRHQRALSEVARAVGAGDLSVQVELRSSDDCLGASVQAMVANLRTSSEESDAALLRAESARRTLQATLTQVSQAVGEIAAAGTQVQSSSRGLTQGASEQADALAETSNSLVEMAEITATTIQSTTQARRIAENAHETAADSGRAMDEMTEAMGRIQDAARGAAQIIGDINQIAFQTNLLALNAAVEAARAGEAGRGFAVVAEEVRNLAQRSKDAADRTSSLLKRSVSEADDGWRSAKLVHERLDQIAARIDEVNRIVVSLTESTDLQRAYGTRIEHAMARMDSVVKQNVRASTGFEAAARELAAESQGLEALVARVFEDDAQDQRAA